MDPPAPSYRAWRDRLNVLGHVFFAGEWNPNLGAIRNRSRTAGAWDDQLILAYEDDRGHGHLYAYSGTTDPSNTWLTSREAHPEGTAIVLPGQHRGCWAVGPDRLHRGRYPAFVQIAPMAFVRDPNRDATLDIEALVAAGRAQNGIRGFNGHRASASSAAPKVGLYSAGCQVWRLPGDFAHALDFVVWAGQWHGMTVSDTIVNEWR